MTVKFMWNGIKVDGELYKAHYSLGTIYDKDVITIYASTYGAFPEIDGLVIENDSDAMTDYFEKDRIRVAPANEHYAAVRAAYRKQNEHNEAMMKKREERRAARRAALTA